MEISISLFLLSLLGAVQITSTQSPVCSVSTEIQLERPLRIGAWNIQKLGKTKMGKPEVVDILVKVMLRYDIILVQEIVDDTLQVPYNLLDELNEAAALGESTPDAYGIALSDRVGTTSKEQYGFYYRKARVTLKTTFLYPDDENAFKYEPFVAVFDTPFAETETIALIAIHTSPNYAESEISALVRVYDTVFEQLGIKDALILGDFNAGCNYVTGGDWASILLRTDQRFDWLISDHIDTTTKGTTCPYDRIVAAGSALKEALYEETAKPFYFDEELGIGQELTEDASDHYPVEILIQGLVTPSLETETKVEVGVSAEVNSSTLAIEQLNDSCREVFTGQASDLRCGTNPNVLIAEPGILLVEFYSQNTDKAIDLLDILSLNNPCVLTAEVTSVLKYKLLYDVLTDASIYGEETTVVAVTTRLLCVNELCIVSLMKRTSVI